MLEGTIGARLRVLRRWRGMSLDELAGLSGLSKSFLSRAERGLRTIDRRSHISALAAALRVSETDLAGGPHLTADPEQSEPHTVVPLLRTALTANAIDDPATDYARPLDEIAALLGGPVKRAEKAANYTRRGELLASALDELHVHVATGTEVEQQQALHLLIAACQGTGMTLRHLGYADLAYLAAVRAREAATRLGEPVAVGRSAWLRIVTLPRSSTSTMQVSGWHRPLKLAEQAADRIEPNIVDRPAAETYGMLRLSAALCAAAINDIEAAQAHLGEARQVADRVGESADAWGDFGPTNVSVWSVAVATEVGDYESAVRAAGQVNPNLLINKERKAMLFAEKGRALAHLPGRQRDAVTALAAAERIAPQRIRNSTPARHTVEVLREQAIATSVSRELRGMAARMGIPQ